MSRTLVAALMLSLLACGGESPTEQPPPPVPLSPITRLVLADSSALVFTGSAVAGQSFVAHAYDATGAEVSNPVLTLSAGSGWTVRGDTVIAPATEGRSTLRITATRPEQASGDWVHLQGTAPAGTTDTMTVTAGIDLRASRWTVSWVCRFGMANGYQYTDPHTSDETPIDSMRITEAPVDTIIYASEMDAESNSAHWLHNMGGVAQVTVSGPMIWWLRDGRVDTVAVRGYPLSLGGQLPDTLVWSDYNGEVHFPMPLTASSPRHYVAAAGYAMRRLCEVPGPSPVSDTLWFDEAP